MSFVYDLRITLFYVAIATFMAWNSVRLYRHGSDSELWLLLATPTALLWFVLADGIQRRWRGDVRTHTTEPDERTVASGVLCLFGLTAVGLWSFWQGHRAATWGLLVGGGLVGLALSLQTLHALRRRDAQSG